MLSTFRFSDYDVFAYLATGLAGLAVTDLVLSTNYWVSANWAVTDGVFAVILAYIVGHLIASLAQWIIERKLVRVTLGRPIEIFLRRSRRGRIENIARRLVRQYYTEPSPKVVAKLREIIEEQGIEDLDDLFVRAHLASKQEPATLVRMDSFLRLYGFARNIAFVGITGGIALAISAAWHYQYGDLLEMREKLFLASISFLLGFGMFERYLKFYRLFVLELVLTLAHAKKDAK